MTRRAVLFVVSAILLCPVYAVAQAGPQPPCGRDGRESAPPYPALGEPPTVTSWSKSDIGRDWKPPACTGWSAPGFSTLVTTVARFRHPAGTEDLLRQVGAISTLAGMRYWSTTHKQWQTLVVDAYALTGLQGQRRADFTPEEMTQGAVLFFQQADNLSGKAIYRMHIAAASPDRIVFDVENVGAMHYLFLTVFHPGEMQSIYFLDREPDNAWRYYGILRTGINASRLATNESSVINRAVAFYRHLAGIPADQEPPAAR